MAKYYLNGNVLYKGDYYKPGDAINISEEEIAKDLLEKGEIIYPEDQEARELAAEAERIASVNRQNVKLPPVKPVENKASIENAPEENTGKPVNPEAGEEDLDRQGHEDEVAKEDVTGDDL